MVLFGKSTPYRVLRRLSEIVRVFASHGFGNLIDQVHLGRHIPILKRLRSFGHWPDLIKGPNAPQRMRVAFADLGPTFIKLAQMISTRPDLVPHTYCNEFKQLLDKVPPFPSSTATRIIEQEIGVPFGSVFKSLDTQPYAAASIAQVHRAVLLDGSDVIVKVQRPGIVQQIQTDIDIMYFIARQIEHYIPESVYLNPTGIVSEFERSIKKELNFLDEGRNANRFRRNFKGFPGIHIPRVYSEFTTEKVLVLERVTGVRIDDIQALDAKGFDRKALARRGIDIYIKSILDDGFFHADPHPGNLIVRDDGSLCFFDFGIVGTVNEQLKSVLANIFVAFMRRDFDLLVDQYIEMGFVPEEVDMEDFRREFKSDMTDYMEPLYGMSLKEIDFAEYLGTVLKIIIKHKIRIPSDLLLIHKAFIILQSIGTRLDPDFDMISATGPHLDKMAARMVDPSRIAHKAKRHFNEFVDLATGFPKQARRILNKVVRNDLEVKLNLKGLDRLIQDMDRSSNRISVSLIISAILLSSAIMHAMGVGPKVYGLSVMGFLVFGCAAFLGIWLIISIIRSGRL